MCACVLNVHTRFARVCVCQMVFFHDCHETCSFFSSPAIPQLHESTLGMFIKSTNLDDGSRAGALVCGANEKEGIITSVHPEIEFTTPMQLVHVLVSGGGKIVWDAIFNLAGEAKLASSAVPLSGNVPSWQKICTPPGEMEQYTMKIDGTSTSDKFQTSVSFTADNTAGLQMPDKQLMVRVPLPGTPCLPPPVVPVRVMDMDPLQYQSQRLF